MARVDISKIKNLISKEDFNLISEQRARATEVTRILSQPLPKIDFNAYKKILVNQSILNQVSEAVSGFKPEKPEIDSVLTSLDEQKVEALKAASKTVEAVEQSVSEFKTNLESIQSLPHYDNLTADVVYEAAPGLEGVYHERLGEGKVFHDDHNFGQRFIG
ncbi:hypothetical protein MP638_001070 [Amoeboaphelidium occidentale]|nr:hypothetical protein MP638_001070 [Amoeboaphelidium occidentale]